MPSPSKSTPQHLAATLELLSELETLVPSLSGAEQAEVRQKLGRILEQFVTVCDGAGLDVPSAIADRAAAMGISLAPSGQ